MFEVLADTEQPVARLPAHVAYAGSDPTVARAAAALREVGVGAAPATPVRLDEARDLFSAIRASDHHELLIAPLATCEIPPAGGAAVPLQDLGPCQAIAARRAVRLDRGRATRRAARPDEDVLGAALAFEPLDR